MSKKMLHIFDWDGTLCQSPLPEFGKPMYEEIFGKPYPHRGWWGRQESLSKEFSIELYEDMEEVAKTAIKDGDLVYVLTSRIKDFTNRIHEICVENNLNISKDKIYTFNTRPKGERIHSIVKNMDNVSKVIFYDDRDKEIISANEWKEEIEKLGVEFEIIQLERGEEN